MQEKNNAEPEEQDQRVENKEGLADKTLQNYLI
jgi:hypothetical protein